MGAAGGCQVWSEAVNVPGWIPLTCGNVKQQRSCRVVRSVRIEVIRGSMAQRLPSEEPLRPTADLMPNTSRTRPDHQ